MECANLRYKACKNTKQKERFIYYLIFAQITQQKHAKYHGEQKDLYTNYKMHSTSSKSTQKYEMKGKIYILFEKWTKNAAET